MSGRKPDFNIKVFDPNREEDRGKYIGVGWSINGGGIAITLDAGICLTTVGARVVLFPRDSGRNDDGRNDGCESRRNEQRPGGQY